MRPTVARFASLIATVAASVGCGVADFNLAVHQSGPSVKGSGPLAKQNRKATTFSRVRAMGAFEIDVRKGSASSIVVEAQQNLLKHIRTEVRGGELVIESDGDMSSNLPMKVHLVTSSLNGIELSGACRFSSKESWKTPRLSISLSGASGLTLPIQADSVDLTSMGASEINLTGSTSILKTVVEGASNFNSPALKVRSATVEATGASEVHINVSQALKVSASGASSVRYSGNPKVTSNTDGAATVGKA